MPVPLAFMASTTLRLPYAVATHEIPSLQLSPGEFMYMYSCDHPSVIIIPVAPVKSLPRHHSRITNVATNGCPEDSKKLPIL